MASRGRGRRGRPRGASQATPVSFFVRCIMFIIASCVIGLGLKVEASRKAIVWENSPLRSRVRVGQICRDCE